MKKIIKNKVGVVIGITRLENSRYGNPNFKLKLKDFFRPSEVTELTTINDASCNYLIDSLLANKTIEYTEVNNTSIKDIKIIGYTSNL